MSMCEQTADKQINANHLRLRNDVVADVLCQQLLYSNGTTHMCTFPLRTVSLGTRLVSHTILSLLPFSVVVNDCGSNVYVCECVCVSVCGGGYNNNMTTRIEYSS